jgi:hypothetical protein
VSEKAAGLRRQDDRIVEERSFDMPSFIIYYVINNEEDRNQTSKRDEE